MALSCTSIYSKKVLHCIDILTALGHNNAVTLIWVPGHVGIRGNEKAGRLAGRGARRVRATQCSVGVPPGEIKKRAPPEQWLQDIGRLNKPRLRRVVGWLTVGQILPLQTHDFKRGKLQMVWSAGGVNLPSPLSVPSLCGY